MFLGAIALICSGLLLVCSRRSLLAVFLGFQPITFGLVLAYLSLPRVLQGAHTEAFSFFILLFGFALVLVGLVFASIIHRTNGLVSVRQAQRLKERDDGMVI
jgi:NADH:ubiquinone oxidoreductase subunit K